MLILGHRGAGALEPENTLRSFRRAVELGVDEIELDLRLSADGRIVLMHDADVDRTTNGSGAVAGLSLAELRVLDAGAGEQIPTFEEVLDQVDLPIQTELKAPEVITPLTELVRRRSVADQLYLTSHDPMILAAAHAALPEIALGLIIYRPDDDIADQCREVGASTACPRLDGLTETMINQLHAAAIRTIPWPVNSADDYHRAEQLGVEGCATDRPDVAIGQWRSPAPVPNQSRWRHA